MEHQSLFGRRRPLKRRKRRPRRYAMEKAFERGGIGRGSRPRPLRKPARWVPDVESELAHPKFASRGDVERDIAGMGDKMRPKPYRPNKMRPKRRRMFFGRPMEKRGVMRRRRRYSNFIGGGGGMGKTLLYVGGALAILYFTPLGKMVGLKK
jgi:hypothetical protein